MHARLGWTRWYWTCATIALTVTVGCDSGSYREVRLDRLETRAPAASNRRTASPALRFSVAAMQSPRNTYGAYTRLFERVSSLLGVEIVVVQRRTYREVNELLLTGQLDAALVCTGGYLELRRRVPTRVEVLAVPRIGGKTTYESVVIVPASSDATSLEGLRGRRFAYTDELSLSGHAYALFAVRQLHEDPLHFFSSTVFTNSHDRSIDAVANGLVDGASVDGLIFEYREDREPDIAEKTRVIHRSSPLGIMPIVAGPALAPEMHARLRDVLLRLHEDPEARAALSVIGIERFVVPAPDLYDAAAAVVAGAR